MTLSLAAILVVVLMIVFICKGQWGTAVIFAVIIALALPNVWKELERSWNQLQTTPVKIL